MQTVPDDDDDVELVPIPLDRQARERLVRLSRDAGKPPIVVAAQLLADLLEDDEAAHQPLN